MGQDQARALTVMLAAVVQIFCETLCKTEISPVGVIHPLAPGYTEEIRWVAELFPQLSGACVRLTSLGCGPAADGKPDRTEVRLKAEFRLPTHMAIWR